MCPMCLAQDGKKLSKRCGAISLTEYRDLGYLPEAVLNYMALLGWSYDEKTDISQPRGDRSPHSPGPRGHVSRRAMTRSACSGSTATTSASSRPTS